MAQPQPSPRRSPGPASRLAPGPLRRAPRDVFLVDLDTFHVSVERVKDPRLEGRPVVVGGLPGGRGVVTCASYEVRACGVRAGMPIFQAVARCPRDTVFLPGDHRAYDAASRQVLAVLRRFTPQVEPVSPDEAWLDLTGCERHHRSWLDAAAAIHRAIRDETGLPCSIGVGASRAIAKIAATMAKPQGVLEVRRGEERAFLAALPLELLPGVGPRTRDALARFNLHTVGDLAAIPTEVLEETFGRTGVALSRRARGLEGDGDEPPIGERPPRTRSISRETSFAADTADLELVEGTLSRLAQRATHALRRDGCLARAVGVRLRYADLRTVEARQHLPRPTDDDGSILALARALWRRRYDRRVRLRLVGVVLHDLAPVRDRQLELPLDGRRAAPGAGDRRRTAYDGLVTGERLDRAVDAVRDRHGFAAIARGIDLAPPARPRRAMRAAARRTA